MDCIIKSPGKPNTFDNEIHNLSTNQKSFIISINKETFERIWNFAEYLYVFNAKMTVSDVKYFHTWPSTYHPRRQTSTQL